MRPVLSCGVLKADASADHLNMAAHDVAGLAPVPIFFSADPEKVAEICVQTCTCSKLHHNLCISFHIQFEQ